MPSITSSGSAAAHDFSGSGSSAAVLEFVCLFTHDLKRKQKRWQDGRLKYHTFNKRIMVHDERGNFVGDMHWHRDWEIEEGEEIELERGGVIVQVAECVGSRNQDLTELLDKRAKEKEERQMKAASRTSLLRPPIQSAPLHRIATPQDHFQTRHRPLHQVIGTPTGHHGRAVVPTESPFEQRKDLGETPDSRPLKRRKFDITPPSKLGYAQSLFGAPLTLSAVPMSSAPRRQPAPQRQARYEISSSPPIRQDQSPASVPIQEAPNASLPRSEPRRVENAFAKPPPRVGRDCDRFSQGEATDDDTLSNAAGVEQERGIGSGPRYGSSRHFNKASVSDGSSPVPPGTPFDKPGNTLETGEMRKPITGSRERIAGAKKKGNSAVIILDDDVENTPVPPDEAYESQRARQKASLQRANNKKMTAQRKKTPPPSSRSPSPLGEAVVNVVPHRNVNEASVSGPKEKEKRTELRLKSRQKRGLMVAAEPPKRIKRPKLGKEGSECSVGRPSDKTAENVSVDKSFDSALSPARKRASPPEEEDPFASSPRAPTRPAAVTRRSRSPPLGEASVSDQDGGRITAPAPEEHECHSTRPPPAARKPSRSPSPPPRRAIGTVNGLANLSPRPAFTISANITKDVRRLPKEAVYDMPDDTDDEYFGILPTPVPHPDQRRDKLVPKKTKSAKVLAEVPTEAIGHASDSSPDSNTPLCSSRSVGEARSHMQTRGARSSNRQSESEDDEPPRARRAARRILIDEELPQVPVGPRLARLGRNVKSKEVIGYIPLSSPVEDEPVPPITVPKEPGPDQAVFPPTRKSSPDLETARKGVSEDADKPLERAAAPRRSETASASSLRRQNSLPETTRSAESRNEVGSGEDAGSAPTHRQTTRPGLVRHRSVAAIYEHEEDRALLPTTATVRMARPADLPIADSSFANDSSTHAGGKNDVQSLSHQTDDLPRHRLKPTNTTHGTIKSICAAGGVVGSDEVPANVPSNPPPRIANPATRGRKAALKSHAAGQVPQSILPPAEPLPARLVARSVPETRLDSSGNERPKRKMTFPGFMSAKGGGPWSREAHDLLDRGRPP